MKGDRDDLVEFGLAEFDKIIDELPSLWQVLVIWVLVGVIVGFLSGYILAYFKYS